MNVSRHLGDTDRQLPRFQKIPYYARLVHDGPYSKRKQSSCNGPLWGMAAVQLLIP